MYSVAIALTDDIIGIEIIYYVDGREAYSKIVRNEESFKDILDWIKSGQIPDYDEILEEYKSSNTDDTREG